MRSLAVWVDWLAAMPAVSVPQQLSYEGRLAAKADGTPTSGTHSIRFAIWPSLTGGENDLWHDTFSVPVVDGLYSVTLGVDGGAPLPPTVFDGNILYLEVTVEGDTLDLPGARRVGPGMERDGPEPQLLRLFVVQDRLLRLIQGCS